MALENSRIVFSAARLRTPWVFPAHMSRYTRRRGEFITIKQVSFAMVLVIAGGLTYSVACVLSSRLFCAALELAMSEWRLAIPRWDGSWTICFVCLICVLQMFSHFANTRQGVQNLLDSLVRLWQQQVGAEHFKKRGVNNGNATTFFHSS